MMKTDKQLWNGEFEAAELIKLLNSEGIYPYVSDGKLMTRSNSANINSEIISLIKQHKQSLLDFLKEDDESPVVENRVSAISRIANRSGDLPLSFAQQRLWFIEQLEGHSTQYHIPAGLRLVGALDISALQFALDSIIERHEVLRTIYTNVDGEGRQTIQAPSAVGIKHINLLSENGEGELRKIIEQEIATPFNLSSDLMLRCTLVKEADDVHVLIFTLHHIAADGWSLGILINEFINFYQARSRGEQCQLPALKIQYCDYTHWQREYLSTNKSRLLDYWRTQLKDIPLVHSIPLDYSRPAEQTFSGAVVEDCIPLELTKALEQLCRQQDCTLFMLLQSVFALLLSRYSNESDVVMGFTSAGRVHPDIEPLVGFFVNTLVIRTDVDQSLTFEQLLKNNKNNILSAYQHQHLPFDQLVEELNPPRSLSHSPLIQVLFSLHNNSDESLKMDDIEIQPVPVVESANQFELELNVKEKATGIELSWLFNARLFEKQSVAHLSHCYITLLHEIVKKVNLPVGEYPLLSRQQQDAIVAQGSGETVIRDNSSVVSLFEKQVELVPDAPAVSGPDVTLTYRQLNQQANQLARCLQAQGVATNSLVGICLERSESLLVALLGILKAGAAYVPFDTKNPEERIAFMLQDSEVSVVITQEDLVAQLPFDEVLPLALDSDFCVNLLSNFSDENLPQESQAKLSDLAYVIYTSGSTGQPKGVKITHAGLQDYCLYAASCYYQPGLAGSLLVTSHSFDITVPALYLPLLSGGSVSLLPPEDEILQLSTQLQGDSCNYLVRMTPVHVKAVLPMLQKNRFESKAKHVFVIGGEALTADVAKQLQQCFPLSQIYNHYGPTETVVGCSIFDVTGNLDKLHSTCPIGKPMHNTQLLVLDSAGNLVPNGVSGELYIGGVGVAQGYLNQAQLSADKFVTCALQPEMRFYRSGDLVHWSKDGQNLYFDGRIDQQVKIRGFRVETGDIENKLIQLPGILEVVVDVFATESGDNQLVAYVVPEVIEEFEEETDFKHWQYSQGKIYRNALQGSIPDYMIPGVFTILQEIPLNANGKVNRKALPAPDFQTYQSYVAPETEMEVAIAEIWQDVLKMDRIGMTENFFELGGHSLLATRVVSEISERLNKEVQVRALFEYPCIRELSAFIEALEHVAFKEIVAVERNSELSLSLAQKRLWFIEQFAQSSSQYNIPVAIKMTGELDKAALQSALSKIVARHEVLRTCYRPVEGECQVYIERNAVFVTEELDLSQKAYEPEDIQKIISTEANKPFDLSNDLMIRGQLLKLAEEQHILLITLHHIASDGWSKGILIEEFVALYQAYAMGASDPLPPLPIQYVDFAVWQQELLSSTKFIADLEYWKRQLDGMPQVHGLPLDFARPAEQTFSAGQLQHSIESDITQQLNQLAQRQGASMFMLVQSALALLIGRWSNEKDVIIGSPVAGREHKNLERLVGFFVNSLILRSNLSENISFEEFLTAQKQTVLEAFEHQHVPFDMLVEELNPERNLSYSPLCQISLTYAAQEQDNLELPGIKVEPLDSDTQRVKLDIDLHIAETDEGLTITWLYADKLFRSETIARMAKGLESLLLGIAAQPATPIYQLPLLTEQDKREVQSFSQVSKDHQQELQKQGLFPQHQSIVTYIEQISAATPDAIALSHGQQELSYQQLNTLANRLARYLIANGVQPEDKVALCFERRNEIIVAMLAVLKAGAAFVVFEPDTPSQRFSFMLQDADIKLVLGHDLAMARHDLAKQKKVLLELTDTAWLDDYSGQVLSPDEVTYQADQLAYLIYTSGSTGEPKGVEVEQRQLIAATLSRHVFVAEPVGRLASMVSFSFDASLGAIFWTLTTGGALEIVEPETAKNPDAIIRLVASVSLTHVLMPPVIYRAVLTELKRRENNEHSSLKVIISGGEALDRTLTAAHFAEPWGNQARFYNDYGPTEATIWSSAHLCQQDKNAESVPIGVSPGHADLYVLDEYRAMQPIGVVGELYIGGAGVARGYHNRPELTAEKFISDALGDGQRVYRSGDLVKWQADGQLAFIGRVDDQVKLRGFRIELAEIEALLKAQPEIADATVVIRGEGAEKRIAAYLIANEENASQELQELLASVRNRLSANLPHYMLPSGYLWLSEFPLNKNNKIDKRALPEPNYQVAQSYSAPQNTTQQVLAEIWQSVLGLEKVGITDNFFEIGGDSILSIQVVARINQAGFHATTKQLFETQTIEKLSAKLTSVGDVSSPRAVAEGEYVLLPIQRKFFAEKPQQQHFYNQAVLLETPDDLDADKLQRMMQSIYQRHDTLRLSFYQEQGQWRGKFEKNCQNRVAQSCVVEQLSDREEFITERCQYWQTQFDLTQGPLIRAVLFVELDKQNTYKANRLFLVAHHLIIDGVSWRILLNDLQSAYEQLHNSDIQLPAATDNIQTWSNALLELSESEALQQEKQQWLSCFSAPGQAVPVDMDLADYGSIESQAMLDIEFSQAQTEALLTQCNQAYHTQINDILLAGVARGLHQWSENQTFDFILEGHGREHIRDDLDITQTLGWFTSFYPLRITCYDDLQQQICDIKERIRSIPDNGLGYGVLRYVSADAEISQLDANICSAIAFNYLGQFDQTLNSNSLFKAAKEDIGQSKTSMGNRMHQLGLNGLITNGVLTFKLDYSRQQYHQQSIESLAGYIKQGISDVIAHCASQDNSLFTPSDFPNAAASATQLQQWQQQYPDINKLYHATPMQKGMFYHSSMDSGAYVNQTYPVIRGPLDLAAFEQAWQRIIARYDVFRTAFVGNATLLQQLVCQQAKMPFIVEDWRHLSAEQQVQSFEEKRAEDKARGFDLGQPPLMRMTIYRLSDERYQLLWTHHHMLIDGWCSGLVYKEVMALYSAEQSGKELSLAPPLAFEDYIQWLLKKEPSAAQRYWHDKLQQFESPTALAMDKWGDKSQAGYQQQIMSLSEAATQSLQLFAKQQKTTINTLLQYAWGYLLHRYSGDRDVLFGATISGRPADLPGVESMVGLFINTIPVKVSFEQGKTLQEQLEDLHHAFQLDIEHGYLPLIDIQAQSNVSGDANLFDSLVIFENYPFDPEEQGEPQEHGLSMESNATDEQTNYKLTLSANIRKNLVLKLNYRGELFSSEAIAAVLQQLQSVLTQMATPDVTNAMQLSLNNYQNQIELLSGKSIAFESQRICDQVDKLTLSAAAKIAVQDAHNSLSYGEIREQSDTIAQYLNDKAIGRGQVVAVCLSRSVRLLPTLLGIMKSGAAYLPIDPATPEARVKHMLSDSAGAMLIADKTALDSAVSDAQHLIPVIDIDALLQSQTTSVVVGDSSLPDGFTMEDTAYVIYTSGSTGQPKGVAVSHAALNNFMQAMHEVLEGALSASTRLLAVTTLSFDIAGLELFGPLIQGGTVFVADAEDVAEPDKIARLLLDYDINLMQATPATWQLLANAQWQGKADLNVLCGGEALPLKLAQFLERNSKSVWNCYGPTEATIWSMVCPVSAQVLEQDGGVKLRGSLANYQHFVLDEHLRPVPTGAVGELFIAGAGLAQGYVNQASLTEQRFVQNPNDVQQTLYHTGDLVRLGACGELEFIGRTDDQIKIRGYRIELGEICDAITALPDVKHCVVKKAELNGQLGLAAYIETDADFKAHNEVQWLQEIKAKLQLTLPHYMVPQAMQRVTQWPLTANGKIDKKALPDINVTVLEHQEPETETERTLASIWAELFALDVSQLSTNTNFFELGGNSLLAVQIANAVNKTLDCEINVKDIFKYQTVSQLALFIDALSIQPQWTSAEFGQDETAELEEQEW